MTTATYIIAHDQFTPDAGANAVSNLAINSGCAATQRTHVTATALRDVAS